MTGIKTIKNEEVEIDSDDIRDVTDTLASTEIVDSDDFEEEKSPQNKNSVQNDEILPDTTTASEIVSIPVISERNETISKMTGNNPQESAHTTTTSDNKDEDDVASKAAVALAAVAAAATANNKSPAEAGREARDLAQSFIRTAVSNPDSTNFVREFVDVPLSLVKSQLARRISVGNGSALFHRLCEGQNDPFLQHLLLMEYYRCYDDTLSPSSEHNTSDFQMNEVGRQQHIDPKIVTTACEKIESCVKRIEAAYDCLVGMLPHPAGNSKSKLLGDSQSLNAEYGSLYEGEGLDDFDRPHYLPDLLPPCSSSHGDATVLFFRACLGETTDPLNTKQSSFFYESSSSLNSVQSTTTTVATKSSDETKEAQESTKSSTSDGSSQGSPSRQSVSSSSGGVFSSMFKRSAIKTTKPTDTSSSSGGIVSALGAGGITGVFRKKKSAKAPDADDGNSTSRDNDGFANGSDDNARTGLRAGDYVVKIEREMLGLTVENVLERTVVRTVVAGGPAKKAGAKVGSLIVKVGNIETKNLTHFETIDELRQSNRPLQLVMREVSEDALRSAREEMGRLIRGSGFGTILDSHNLSNRNRPITDTSARSEGESSIGSDGDGHADGLKPVRPLIGADLRLDAYTTTLRRRFAEAVVQPRNKKEEALIRAGEKLVWILSLLVVGLEREEAIQRRQSSSFPSLSSNYFYNQHSAKDFTDSAKSVSKVLHDYVSKTMDTLATGDQKSQLTNFVQNNSKGTPLLTSTPPPPPPPLPPARGSKKKQLNLPGIPVGDASSMVHDKPLQQIGDVLQRTRTFLADTMSPPAALLRGELISFLCDILDIDTEMELAEDEAASATAGGSAVIINDLGSAGSLLKLIVLNCNAMRSSLCEDESSRHDEMDADLAEELKRRFGPKVDVTKVEMHKLHAGNRFLAVVHRLAASRSTSARVTACSLGPVLWGHLDFPHQLQLRGVITRALHDVEVTVRKSTATVLHEIAELVFDKRSVPWLVLMCERAMTDPEPQLRSAAMTLTWHLGEHLPNAFLGDASQGSRYLRRLPSRDDPLFADVYLLQCKLLPVATRLAEDRSPSVRLAVAAQCDRLCDALGDHWSSVIIDVLHGLLGDIDERVRCEAVACVPRISEIVLMSASPGETAVSEISILESLVPASIKLQKDQSISVRVSLAAAAGELLTLLVAMQTRASEALSKANHDSFGLLNGNSERRSENDGGKRYKAHVDDRLIPLVQTLLNDADPEITSAALRAVTNATRSSVQNSRTRQLSINSEDDLSMSSYHSHTSRDKPVFLPVLSENQVLRLLPTLAELAESRQWRVRQSAVEIVPALLGCTHMLETRSEISKLCVRLMRDQVDAVRKTAAECLCMGASSLGSHGEDDAGEWITSIVIPNIRKCAMDPMSKQRLLSLKMIEVVLLNGICPGKWYSTSDAMTDSPMRDLVTIALSLTNDRIANVRLNVGRVLDSVLHVLDEQDVAFIREVLHQQIEAERESEGGGDRDVLYYATLCLNRSKTVASDRSFQGSDSLSVL
jgi:PDZ domain